MEDEIRQMESEGFRSWATLRGRAKRSKWVEAMSDSDEDLKAELERLRAENEALKEGSKKGLRFQVSAICGVCLYCIRRFPITFY